MLGTKIRTVSLNAILKKYNLAHLHFHQEVMTLIEVALGHTNANRKRRRAVDSMSLDPRLGGILSSLMQNMACWKWHSCNFGS